MKKIYHFFDNVIVQFLMSTIPTTWFCFFSVFSQQSRLLTDESGNLTVFSVVVNILMVLIMFIFSVGVIVEKSLEKKQAIREDKIHNSIITGIDECSTILRNKQIENLGKSDKEILMSDYRSDIYIIMGNLLTCLTEITQIERSAFVATYFYKSPLQDDWCSVSSDDGYKGVKQADLLKNEASVVCQLLQHSDNVFYPSKEMAKQKEKYIPDQRDFSQGDYGLPMGSIFGSNWSIKSFDGEKIFESVITIATYGKELCAEKDSVTKKTLIENVLKVFKHQFIQTAFTYTLVKK